MRLLVEVQASEEEETGVIAHWINLDAQRLAEQDVVLAGLLDEHTLQVTSVKAAPDA